MKHAPWIYGVALLFNAVVIGLFLRVAVQASEPTAEFDARTPGILYLIWVILICVAAILVVLDVRRLFRSNNLYGLIRAMRTIKLVMIPFFIFNFIVSLLALASLSIIPGAPLLVFWIPVGLTYVLFLPTTLYGLASLIFSYRYHVVGTKSLVFHGIAQLVFCIDMISAFLLFRMLRDYPATTLAPRVQVAYPQRPESARAPAGPAGQGGPPRGFPPPGFPPPGSPPPGSPPPGSPPRGAPPRA